MDFVLPCAYTHIPKKKEIVIISQWEFTARSFPSFGAHLRILRPIPPARLPAYSGPSISAVGWIRRQRQASPARRHSNSNHPSILLSSGRNKTLLPHCPLADETRVARVLVSSRTAPEASRRSRRRRRRRGGSRRRRSHGVHQGAAYHDPAHRKLPLRRPPPFPSALVCSPVFFFHSHRRAVPNRARPTFHAVVGESLLGVRGGRTSSSVSSRA
jgi:hypothetical protein